jgi:hypothetical protein
MVASADAPAQPARPLVGESQHDTWGCPTLVAVLPSASCPPQRSPGPACCVPHGGTVRGGAERGFIAAVQAAFGQALPLPGCMRGFRQSCRDRCPHLPLAPTGYCSGSARTRDLPATPTPHARRRDNTASGLTNIGASDPAELVRMHREYNIAELMEVFSDRDWCQPLVGATH